MRFSRFSGRLIAHSDDHAAGQTTDAVSNPGGFYSTSRLFRKPTPQRLGGGAAGQGVGAALHSRHRLIDRRRLAAALQTQLCQFERRPYGPPAERSLVQLGDQISWALFFGDLLQL
jgi:hypothetical protein